MYYLLSFPAMLLWHDFYAYWTHRLLHSRRLFRRVHGLHHLHHETAQGNYGLWFTWWDRWVGTEKGGLPRAV